MVKKLVALLMVGVMLVGSASAICAHSSYKVYYKDHKSCAMGCGFLGIYNQDYWTQTVRYNCVNGTKEDKVTYYAHNGSCC